ncbi:hypothetical protein GH721_03255 [Kriegella sp. EG-1]|nr:hypothetical protein [Flavobacteriaceae bacterium EG-1]
MIQDIIEFVKEKWKVDRRLLLLYGVIYFCWGLGMNWFGTYMEIAKFTYWWQVITCYIFYMIPISLVLRHYSFHHQYAYGLIAMCILEFLGYALKTSYAYPNNLLDQVFGIRNFSLGMAMFFALYFPVGNWVVAKLYKLIYAPKA